MIEQFDSVVNVTEFSRQCDWDLWRTRYTMQQCTNNSKSICQL